MRMKLLSLIPAAFLAVACGRNSSPSVDDALKNDLALASQAQAYNPQQTLSPTEQGYAPQAASAARNYQPRTVSAPVHHSSTVHHSSSSGRSSGVYSSGSSGTYYPPAPPPVHTVKHTQRDAAIGAAAGAVLGATTSRNKVKGGLIGAAVGGILGGVLGNNVDVQKKVGW